MDAVAERFEVMETELADEKFKALKPNGIDGVHCSVDADSFDPDEVVAGCFEFRVRTRSFDLHQLSHGNKHWKGFGRLFRSPSDSGQKQQVAAAASASSPTVPATSSPRHSPPHRRRLVRVVRDVNPDVCGEVNPHVVHKYSQAFLQRRTRSRTASESECSAYDRPLPYEVTGHTILKRPSLDRSTSVNSCNSAGIGAVGAGNEELATPPINKHASFRDEVVVIEFDRKCKVVDTSSKHVVPLHDTVFDDADSYAACKSFEDLSIDATIAALTKDVDIGSMSNGTTSVGCCSTPEDDSGSVVKQQQDDIDVTTKYSVGDDAIGSFNIFGDPNRELVIL